MIILANMNINAKFTTNLSLKSINEYQDEVENILDLIYDFLRLSKRMLGI